MTDHIPDATKKVLLPAAEAIFFAADGMQPRQYRGKMLAAALRALADQVVPTKPEPVTYPGDNKEEFIARYNVWLNMRLTRNKILAIATELEALPND